MALIACYECGHHISEHAESCPQCGAPNEKSAKDESKPYPKGKFNEEIYHEQRVSAINSYRRFNDRARKFRRKAKNIRCRLHILISYSLCSLLWQITVRGYEKDHAGEASLLHIWDFLAGITYLFS